MDTRYGAKSRYSGQGWRACKTLIGKKTAIAAFVFLAMTALSGAAFAQESELDSGDTAWMLTATALVLFMTIPGLSLFYAGLVRSKNVLSVLMQCFAITAMASVIWVCIGYSIAFNTDGMEEGVVNFNSFAGGLGTAFLHGVTTDSLSGTFPETIQLNLTITTIQTIITNQTILTFTTK